MAMNRRGFFSWLGLGAASAGVAMLPAPALEAAGNRWSKRVMDLGENPFTTPRGYNQPMRLWVNANFSEIAFLDALRLFPKMRPPSMLELVIGWGDLKTALEVQKKFDSHAPFEITVNTHRSWQDYRWAVVCNRDVVFSTGA